MARFSILLWCSLFGNSIAQAKLKVFVLAGQSNMQGTRQLEMKENSHNGGQGTLANLVKNEKTANKYAHLLNKKGEWITRQDGWIRYDDRRDGLRPGFGYRNMSIGPELGFGSVVGDAIEEPVLLIKTCWGGKEGRLALGELTDGKIHHLVACYDSFTCKNQSFWTANRSSSMAISWAPLSSAVGQAERQSVIFYRPSP